MTQAPPSPSAQMELLLDPEKEREWVETFLTVPSEDEGIVQFLLTEQQKRIISTARKVRKLIIVKGRQTRCSSIVLAKLTRKATTEYGQNFVVITQTDDMSQNFRARIKFHLQNLAEHGLEYEIGRDNEKILEIRGMKNVIHFASAEQKVGLRGLQTAHFIHASEIAHWPEESAKRIIGGLLPASPANGWFIMESTPNGAAGQFYQYATDAMPLVPVSKWTVAFYPWWLERKYTLLSYTQVLEDAGVDVEHLRFDFRPSPAEETLMSRESLNVDQMLWRRLQSADLIKTGQYFAQEYPEDLLSCWLASGVCFFHDDLYDHLAYYRENVKQPAERRSSLPYEDPVTGVISDISFLGPNLQVWEPPIPGQQYVGFLDVSAGVSGDGDYSALVIMNAKSRRIAATLRVRTLPQRVGLIAGAICAWYNWAFLGVERNSYGQGALEKLNESHYPNLYYDVINNPQHPEQGWFTSPSSRELMLGRLREAVFNHTIEILDPVAVIEMGGFSWKQVTGRSGAISFRAEAERGNDDLVIALAGVITIAPYAPARVKSGRINVVYGTGEKGRAPDLRLTVDASGVVQQEVPSAQYPWLR